MTIRDLDQEIPRLLEDSICNMIGSEAHIQCMRILGIATLTYPATDHPCWTVAAEVTKAALTLE